MGHRSILYELVVDLSTGQWGVDCPLNQELIGPVQYGWDRFSKDQNSMTFGGGLLAGSSLPGTRRMIFCGHSPQWEGFYVSALGGAMHVFHRVGVNYVWLRGQAKVDSVLVIKHINNVLDIQIKPINADQIWDGYTDPSGRQWTGFYALQKSLFEQYKGEYPEDYMRILALGPASRLTKEGAIGSNHVKHGELTVIDDWAGRGGLGSQMLQQHRIAGIVFGGDWEDPALKEGKELDGYFLEHFGQKAMATDLAFTQKYRYQPKFETGGTFGVNMHEAEDRLLSFNYQSVYESSQARSDQHDQFIVGHYLKQFNEESIATKNFNHCGEPCPVVCKKYVDEFKKDYEPYQAIGPNCGIFDQRAAEKANKFVDTMGWDAIQAGGTVSWLMELLAEKMIPASDFGLTQDLPRFKFASQASEFDLVDDSMHNALYAIEIMKMILFTPQGEPFRKGLRSAAKWLDQKYTIRSIDRAVYTAHGEEGCMVPNQYWTAGVFSPMPMMGKYFNFYGLEFIPPYQLGRKNVERFVYELFSENSGACRFHRKWVEDIIDEITCSHFDLDINFWYANFELAKSIHLFQSDRSTFWESERVVDIINEYLKKWQENGLKNDDLEKWIAAFNGDKWHAARSFWEDMYRGMTDAFKEGISEPAHVEHGFIQK